MHLGVILIGIIRLHCKEIEVLVNINLLNTKNITIDLRELGFNFEKKIGV